MEQAKKVYSLFGAADKLALRTGDNMRLDFTCVIAVLAVVVSTPAEAQKQDQIRLNQIQVIGSHNSYHAGLAPSEAVLLRKSDPKAAANLDYRHPALDLQLANGVRQLELDIFADSKGEIAYLHPQFVPAFAWFPKPGCRPILPLIRTGS